MQALQIELCPEDRARLDAILAALQGTVTTLTASQAETAQEATKETISAPVKAKAEKATEAKQTSAPTPEELPTVTVEDLQALVGKAISLGKKNEAKAVIQAYSPKISGVPADKRAEAYAKLKQICE